jgi:hypothetical protein
MADERDLSEIVRRTVQANAKLYKGWVDLSLDYFRAVADIFGGVPEPARSPADDPDDNAGAVVLEGEESTSATAAFLVTNDLGRKLQCALVASDFRDADGARMTAKLSFEPAKFELSPGQQAVVQVSVPIDRGLAEGVAYSGEISIQGMDGFSVPAVIRRQHAVELSPIDRVAEDEGAKTATSPTAGSASRRSTGAAGKGAASSGPAKKGGAAAKKGSAPARKATGGKRSTKKKSGRGRK